MIKKLTILHLKLKTLSKVSFVRNPIQFAYITFLDIILWIFYTRFVGTSGQGSRSQVTDLTDFNLVTWGKGRGGIGT